MIFDQYQAFNQKQTLHRTESPDKPLPKKPSQTPRLSGHDLLHCDKFRLPRCGYKN